MKFFSNRLSPRLRLFIIVRSAMSESISRSVIAEWMRLSINVVAALGVSSKLPEGVGLDEDGISAEEADGDCVLGNGTV